MSEVEWTQIGNVYCAKVRSESGHPYPYVVQRINGRLVCSCPHFQERLAYKENEECKHIKTARKDAQRLLHQPAQKAA